MSITATGDLEEKEQYYKQDCQDQALTLDWSRGKKKIETKDPTSYDKKKYIFM